MRALARVVWAMMRAPVLVLLCLYAASGLAVAGSASAGALLRVMLVLVPFLVYSAVVNDLADARIDAINLPDDARRVLAAGRAHRRHLWTVAALGLAAALGGALALGRLPLLVVGAGVLVSTAYSLGPVRLAQRGFVASLTLPACYVAVPYLLGVLAGRQSVSASDLPLLAALYVGFIGRIILKDFRDVRGDALFGKRTFLVRHGRVAACRVSAACWVTASLLVVLVSPHRSPVMAVSTLVGAALAAWLLRQLAGDPGHRTEEHLISALAILGRGTVLVVILPMWSHAAGTPRPLAEALLAGVAVLTAGQALDLRKHGPARLSAVRSGRTRWDSGTAGHRVRVRVTDESTPRPMETSSEQ